MGMGLEVYTPGGALMFDAATLTTRLLAVIGVGTSDGSAGFPQTNNYYVAWPTRYTGGVPPRITTSPGVVSWTFGSTPVGLRSGCTILVFGY